MVTSVLISLAAIPGYIVSTVTLGIENSGSLFTGREKIEKTAAINIAVIIMITVTGRRIKKVINPFIFYLLN